MINIEKQKVDEKKKSNFAEEQIAFALKQVRKNNTLQKFVRIETICFKAVFGEQNRFHTVYSTSVDERYFRYYNETK